MDYSQQRKFAEDLARALDDMDSLAWYEATVQEYNYKFLRDTLIRVLKTRNIRNKGAYFNTLVRINGKKSRMRGSFESELFD